MQLLKKSLRIGKAANQVDGDHDIERVIAKSAEIHRVCNLERNFRTPQGFRQRQFHSSELRPTFTHADIHGMTPRHSPRRGDELFRVIHTQHLVHHECQLEGQSPHAATQIQSPGKERGGATADPGPERGLLAPSHWEKAFFANPFVKPQCLLRNKAMRAYHGRPPVMEQ